MDGGHGELARREQIGREKSRGQGVGWLWGRSTGRHGGVLLFVRGKLGLVVLSPCVLLPYVVHEEGRRGKRKEKTKRKEKKDKKKKIQT
jgi:hypothetical protein